MTAAPAVGYNLTYVCPEGQVFNHDWFATPFVMMTCQVLQQPILIIIDNCTQENGEFDIPDWSTYQCVFRKFISTRYYIFNNISFLATTTECYDCTTTSKYKCLV